MLNDDDWELFVPVKQDKYPNSYQVKLHEGSIWQEGGSPGLVVKDPSCYAYRKPKQKETNMPDRTPQKALRDAIDSGAVEAWINGEKIEYRVYGSVDKWTPVEPPRPDFALHGIEYRPKPPEPTKINWQPVVVGKEPADKVLLLWKSMQCCFSAKFIPEKGKWIDHNGTLHVGPAHWAPMCNLPEGDE